MDKINLDQVKISEKIIEETIIITPELDSEKIVEETIIITPELDSEKIILNARGKKITIYKSLLLSSKSSYFLNLVGEGKFKANPEKDGSFFVDFDIDVLRVILAYLETGEISTSTYTSSYLFKIFEKAGIDINEIRKNSKVKLEQRMKLREKENTKKEKFKQNELQTHIENASEKLKQNIQSFLDKINGRTDFTLHILIIKNTISKLLLNKNVFISDLEFEPLSNNEFSGVCKCSPTFFEYLYETSLSTILIEKLFENVKKEKYYRDIEFNDLKKFSTKAEIDFTFKKLNENEYEPKESNLVINF